MTTVCDLARELGTTAEFLYDLVLPDCSRETAALNAQDDDYACFHEVLSPEEVHRYRQAWVEWVKEGAATSISRWVAFFSGTQDRSMADDLVLTQAAGHGADVALSVQALADLDRRLAAEVIDSQGAEHAERLREIVSDDMAEDPIEPPKGVSGCEGLPGHLS